MVDNQHRKITGYRDLTEREIELMNEIKARAGFVGELVAELELLVGVDRRWLAIGQTNLQQGFMALTRAVAKPETF